MTLYLPMTETLDSCPLCGESTFCRRYAPDICQCSACSVYFRNPRPDETVVLRSYNAGITYRQWQQELDIRAHLWKKRCSLISRYCPTGALLDVGTGDGYFLDFVKSRYDVSATEVSGRGVAYVQARGHFVHLGTILDTEFDERKFDIITMWHVLEHVPNPGQVLERVKSLLKPDGHLFIAVPNECVPLYRTRFRLKNIHPFGLLAHGQEIHLFHFTPRVLLDALKHRFGFRIVEFGVDDVHVYKRHKKLARYVASKLCARLVNWHWDTAMTVVCTPDARDQATVWP